MDGGRARRDRQRAHAALSRDPPRRRRRGHGDRALRRRHHGPRRSVVGAGARLPARAVHGGGARRGPRHALRAWKGPRARRPDARPALLPLRGGGTPMTTRLAAEPDVTPMIDVLLVLLVTFLM